MHRLEGWRAYFKGIGPTLLGAVPVSAIKFYMYRNTKRILSDINNGRETAWVYLMAAATAGIIVSTAINPI
jgi:solute carrier family 25 protein 33/36